MRLAVACFAQESHSFSPIAGSWDHFGENEITRGEALLREYAGTGTELGGVFSVLERKHVIPLIAARANASAGVMQRDVFEGIRDELLERLKQSLPVDGVLMVLHGATVADGYDDACGNVLENMREIVGGSVPIVATLDLHANVTRKMVENADALVGYHTYPHIDMFETGQRAASILQQTLDGALTPRMSFKKIPMMSPGETTQTTHGAYSDIIHQAETFVQENEEVVDISVFSVQPWLDVPEMGSSVIVVTNNQAAVSGDVIAARLANAFWERRKELLPTLPSTEEAVTIALSSNNPPVILADGADAPTSGAPGDSTAILKILVHKFPQKLCLLNIVDPHAVREMTHAGIGSVLSVKLGGGFAPDFYEPLQVQGRVRLLSDGIFTHKGPGMRGLKMYRGLTGVLEISSHIVIVVMERPCWQWDAELYRSLGLAPEDAQLVVVKSPAAFRASYEPFAGEIIVCDTKGICSPDLATFPFQHVSRPLFPLDDFEWDPGI